MACIARHPYSPFSPYQFAPHLSLAGPSVFRLRRLAIFRCTSSRRSRCFTRRSRSSHLHAAKPHFTAELVSAAADHWFLVPGNSRPRRAMQCASVRPVRPVRKVRSVCGKPRLLSPGLPVSYKSYKSYRSYFLHFHKKNIHFFSVYFNFTLDFIS